MIILLYVATVYGNTDNSRGGADSGACRQYIGDRSQQVFKIQVEATPFIQVIRHGF